MKVLIRGRGLPVLALCLGLELAIRPLGWAGEMFQERPALSRAAAGSSELMTKPFALEMNEHLKHFEVLKIPQASLVRLENLAKREDKAAEMLLGLLTDPAFAEKKEALVAGYSPQLMTRIAAQARAIQRDPSLKEAVERASAAFSKLQKSLEMPAADAILGQEKSKVFFDGSGEKPESQELAYPAVITPEKVSAELSAHAAVPETAHEPAKIEIAQLEIKPAERTRTISKTAFRGMLTAASLPLAGALGFYAMNVLSTIAARSRPQIFLDSYLMAGMAYAQIYLGMARQMLKWGSWKTKERLSWSDVKINLEDAILFSMLFVFLALALAAVPFMLLDVWNMLHGLPLTSFDLK